MGRLLRMAIVGAMLLSMVAVNSGTVLALLSSTIDLEGLPEGKIVTSLATGGGISGDAVAGSVAVAGSPKSAITFDAECSGGCTGGDDDLHFPGQGNVLVVAENLTDSDGDGLVDNPDDADINGQYITFDFSGFGTGATARTRVASSICTTAVRCWRPCRSQPMETTPRRRSTSGSPQSPL